MEIKLPVSGHVVEVRERVGNRDRKQYLKTLEAGPMEMAPIAVPVIDPEKGEPLRDDDGNVVTVTEQRLQPTGSSSSEIGTVMLALLVTGWTLDVPFPDSLQERADILDDLDIEDYDHLLEEASPIVRKLFVTNKPSMDPEDGSPSGPSNE